MAMDEGDLVTRLLRQSILTLCREAVAFRCRLDVDGIICLTADDQQQHVVKIHEIFDKNSNPEVANLSGWSTALCERGSPASGSIIRYAPNSLPENEIPSHGVKDVDNTVIKTDTDSDLEVEPRENLVQVDAAYEMETGKYLDALTSVDYASMGLDKFVMSSAKNIHCKKCNSTHENVALFQVHNMTVHGQFTCLVCLGTFTSKNNMKRHIRLHTGIKPYSCHKCPESFSRNDDFKRHLVKHAFQKPFRCTVCNTDYSERSGIKSHMLKDHNCKVFHICPQCGQSYTDLQEFQQHRHCHPEFHDYRCTLCSFTGSNALMYNKHMLTHGPRKEYKCTYCDLSYSDPFMYTGHMKKHKGDERVQSFACCFCDMSLPSFELFQRHEHTHIHSKQHTCNQCNKVFRYPSNLREHMLTHLPKHKFSRREAQFDNTHAFYDDTRSGGDIDLSMTVGRKLSTEIKMETDEENNNELTSSKEAVYADLSDRDDISGSSEYWCTECNQGFATEGRLKVHITCKHEVRDDGTEGGLQNSDNLLKAEKENSVTGHVSVDVHDGITRSTPSPSSLDSSPIERYKYVWTMDKKLSDTPSISQTKQDHSNSKERIVLTRVSHVSSNGVAKCDSTGPIVDIIETGLHPVHDTLQRVQNMPRFVSKQTELERLRANMKGVKKIDSIERSNSCSHRSNSSLSVPSKLQRNLERSMSVSVTGMKMKIQRTSQLTSGISKGSDFDVTGYTHDNEKCEGQKDGVRSDHCRQSSAPGTDTDTHITQNSIYPTTLNLQVRNPGFERVITPDVLFKTKAPFTCEVCQETYADFNDFHEHGVKVHRRFICSYCGKVFTSRPNRERHIRYHTGEKPYKCDLCMATFLRGDDLKYHRTTKHVEIKPFTCGACQASFSLPKELENHLRVYTDHRL